MSNNLYEVKTSKYTVFAVAEDVLEASNLVTRKLNNEDWGYSCDRQVLNVKWIATTDSGELNISDDRCLLAM